MENTILVDGRLSRMMMYIFHDLIAVLYGVGITFLEVL